MRKNWTKHQDNILQGIVTDLGPTDWTAVAQQLRHRYELIERSGKQCRQRWYNHLDPKVNKKLWTIEEEAKLFELQKVMGNKWKEISLLFEGRTDNNIKNHFYSALRRSLRRLNKIIGEKNSTIHLREIKPSVLTIILNFIYDHQEAKEENQVNNEDIILLKNLKELPKLIFEFSEFKPIRENMHHLHAQDKREQIQLIFNLIDQFKESYLTEKEELESQRKSKKRQKEEEPFKNEEIKVENNGTYTTQSLFVTILKERSKSYEINEQDKENLHKTSQKPSILHQDENFRMKQQQQNYQLNHFIPDFDEPSPLTNFQQHNPFPQLVIIGKRWQPKKEEVEKENYIDEILAIQYD